MLLSTVSQRHQASVPMSKVSKISMLCLLAGKSFFLLYPAIKSEVLHSRVIYFWFIPGFPEILSVETDGHRACQITAISPLQKRDTIDHSPLHIKYKGPWKGHAQSQGLVKGRHHNFLGALTMPAFASPVPFLWYTITQIKKTNPINQTAPNLWYPSNKKVFPQQSWGDTGEEHCILLQRGVGFAMPLRTWHHRTTSHPGLAGTEEFSQPFPATCFCVSWQESACCHFSCLWCNSSGVWWTSCAIL